MKQDKSLPVQKSLSSTKEFFLQFRKLIPYFVSGTTFFKEESEFSNVQLSWSQLITILYYYQSQPPLINQNQLINNHGVGCQPQQKTDIKKKVNNKIFEQKNEK
ncbi:hypothetical protein KUTeg_015589 [Tegillarca granosa]|uniref:Uncharacterized protein n=1 Tax=Tegillarca granosa TaxID=220873 RepID=A0ABQ9EQS6_TEGGR|nr:hypothetical protein KUTeg_015589 [Tegillarca granosa]